MSEREAHIEKRRPPIWGRMRTCGAVIATQLPLVCGAIRCPLRQHLQ
jgi:hypothetical protein